MLFIPMFQAVVGFTSRQENYERVPAFSAQPVSTRLRLAEDQVEELVEEYHHHRDQGRALYGTSRRMMETFLPYLAGGGYHRQAAYSQGIAKSTAIRHNNEVAENLLIH